MCSQQKRFPKMIFFWSTKENLLQQMKDIGEKTHIIQTWEASYFFLKMVPSAFGKPARNTLSFKTLTK